MSAKNHVTYHRPKDLVDAAEIPKVTIAGRRFVVIGLVLLIIMSLWAVRHIISMRQLSEGHGHSLTFVWFLVYLSLVVHLVLAWREPTYSVAEEQQPILDKLFVTLNVPLFNEEDRIVELVTRSILGQTRLPNRVQIVDDGSFNRVITGERVGRIKKLMLQLQGKPIPKLKEERIPRDYSSILDSFVERARALGIDASWVRQENAGKREAQLTTFRPDNKADIFITLDSDTVLEHRAIEEGIKPFTDPQVTSVAGVILAQNSANSWFTRVTDAWLLAFQLCVRSALSTVGTVLVNSGNYALYRADTLRKAFDGYANETFAGQPMQFSDDSLLTLYARMENNGTGKTVQQPTAFAFTVLPESIGHHVRQQLRWMRGSFIRSWWRLKYLPTTSFGYWEHFFAWVNFILVSLAFSYLMVWRPVIEHKMIPLLFYFAVLVAYATAAKYLTIRRTDHSFAFQLGTFLLAPVMLVWVAFVLRPLRIYAMLTCYKTDWGTRANGNEVKLATATA